MSGSSGRLPGRARHGVISAAVGALAAIAMMMPVASAQAATQQPADASAEAGASAAPIADTSADGVQRVAKTHEPQVEQQLFSAPAAVTSNGGDVSGDAGENSSGSSGELGDNAVDPYSLDAEPRSRSAEPRSRSAEPRQGSGSGSSDTPSTPSSPQPQSQPVTVSAELSGLATVGVTWKQQDMKDADKAPTYQLRYFRDNAWSDWQTIPSVDDDFGKMGVSPSYYVGDATKVEAQLTPAAGQTLTEAKLVTIDSGYSAVGDAQTSAYRSESSESKADTTDKASADDTYPVEEAGAVRSAISTPTPTVRTAAAVTATGRIHKREE